MHLSGMVYTHKGKIGINGIVDGSEIITDAGELFVLPGNDGRQIDRYRTGDFEWWYFDINDRTQDLVIKLILHTGTDPLRKRIISQFAVSVASAGISGSIIHAFDNSQLKAEAYCCDLAVGNFIRIRVENDDNSVYRLIADIPQFRCDLTFTGESGGWKPFGNKVLFRRGNRETVFSWVIPQPVAKVRGKCLFRDRNYTLSEAIGYHDHNYIMPDRNHPLFMDEIVKRWLWGKCNAGRFTMIFGDVRCRNTRILPFMVAEDNRIIHSSNNLIECSETSAGYDGVIKTDYPASLEIKSLDESLPFRAEFDFLKIVDHKDLLEGINPALRFLIRKLISRPSYHGIFARARITAGDYSAEGYGNYESMVFRG